MKKTTYIQPSVLILQYQSIQFIAGSIQSVGGADAFYYGGGTSENGITSGNVKEDTWEDDAW